jgi:conjugative relaxase-like TrwC/TraI family protein
VVASISARGSAKAALAYYDHLRRDDYYTSKGEPPGRWAGRGAERLSLDGPVTQAEFEAALDGRDPKTGELLVQRGGRSRSHDAGWDMTFSAPKSVSVLWALSEPRERQAIKQAHQAAVDEAGRFLEADAAWCRRGKGGAVHERTAGLLVANFDHHTSRALDPQLHTHSFIFNLAPRHDGSWGAIVSKRLYQAQKQAGAIYRRELARQLERQGHLLDRQGDSFRVAAIPPEVERAFSKRRQAIEEAAREHGYKSAKGMELATLRTRRAKGHVDIEERFQAWQAEAKALGFELGRQQERQPQARHGRHASKEPNRRDDGERGYERSRAMSAKATDAEATAGREQALPDSVAASLRRFGAAMQQAERPAGAARINLRQRPKRGKNTEQDIEIEL